MSLRPITEITPSVSFVVPKLYQNVSNLINYTNCHSSYIIVKSFFLYLCRTLQQKNVNDYNIRLYRIIFKLYHNFNTLRDSISNKMLRSRWEEQVEGRGGGSPGKAFWGRLNLGPCFKFRGWRWAWWSNEFSNHLCLPICTGTILHVGVLNMTSMIIIRQGHEIMQNVSYDSQLHYLTLLYHIFHKNVNKAVCTMNAWQV